MKKIGIVGATGVVGQTFLQLIEERAFSFTEIRPFASASSVGQEVSTSGKSFPIQELHEGCFEGLDIVFFSSGDEISKTWAPKAVAQGAWAIDNSAAFRMNPDHPLVVPEVNFDQIKADQPTVIANPNCSTIQLVLMLNALKPLDLKSVRVSTYQAVSGAGRDAVIELDQHSKLDLGQVKNSESQNFSRPVAFNCLPEIGSFGADGFTSEENKIRLETKKILSLPELPVSALTVRIPVYNGHSEAAWVEFEKDVTETEIFDHLEKQEGLTFSKGTDYKSALEMDGKNPVHVGRIHKDADFPNTWIFWIVADNLRKGAALNGIQIAEKLQQL